MSVPGYETSPETVKVLRERLQSPFKWKSPRRIFVNSMADLFHPEVPFDFVRDTFLVMQEAANRNGHIFQVLTKRPGRAVGWWKVHQGFFPGGWPPNVWIGTSVESQKYAPRLTVLARLPAPMRFVSAEPLLEPVDLTEWLSGSVIQWVIAGGESGFRARPMDLNWARDLRDQSEKAGVPFFLKQLGGRRSKRAGSEALLDGRTWQEFPEVRNAL